ncbi:MAG TPA: carboxypeptidase regulatory-like domain-containing protein [Bryobacteraceae bacterium]|nr:carboxypeptidase regulatory-like domain-containing protein [Bryobacteraceae bacterium]
MKIRLSLLFLAAALFAQQNPAKPDDRSGIEGQVTNAATGAPVKKSDVVLQRVDLNTNTGTQQTNYSTTTDAGGRFAMKDIEPGKYRLSANGNGFVQAMYGARGPNRPGTTISLDAGQYLKEVDLKLTPHGVVTGRIVDEDGDPVVRGSVQAQSYSRTDGRKQLVPSGSASTNDLGEYRIFGLAPGRYYLSATYNQEINRPTLREKSAKPPPVETYAATYYPSAIDIATAAAVDVIPGAELRGINIALAKTHTVRLRGHVNYQGGADKQGVTLMLTRRDETSPYNMFRHDTDEQGNFEIRGVRPGAYVLVAQSFDRAHGASARQAIDVGNNDMDGIVLTLNPGVELKGQVKAEGPDGINLASIYVLLHMHEVGAAPGDRVHDDGTFTLPQVAEEQYNVRVMGVPDGYYVKSIRAGGQEVRDSGLDMTSGAPGPLTVTIAPGAGQIEGVVQNDKQAPAAGALVVLIPDDSKRRGMRDAYHIATTDQYGKFTLKNVDPGDYKLYAWDDVEPGAYMDPDFVKPFESQAVAMSIHENSRESAQLKLIPAEN